MKRVDYLEILDVPRAHPREAETLKFGVLARIGRFVIGEPVDPDSIGIKYGPAFLDRLDALTADAVPFLVGDYRIVHAESGKRVPGHYPSVAHAARALALLMSEGWGSTEPVERKTPELQALWIQAQDDFGSEFFGGPFCRLRCRRQGCTTPPTIAIVIAGGSENDSIRPIETAAFVCEEHALEELEADVERRGQPPAEELH